MKINFPCNYFHIPVNTYKNNNIKNIVEKKKLFTFENKSFILNEFTCNSKSNYKLFQQNFIYLNIILKCKINKYR